MTKKEMFAHIATVNSADTEIVAFCEREIELLENRKTSKSPTKTQKANEGIMDTIERDLKGFENPVTVTELIAGGEGLEGLTNQKVSALLRKMVEAKRVTKTIEGKKALFAVA
jgi:hypothetical protein